MDAVPAPEELTAAECIAHLRDGRVGRVGTTIAALPAVLPVSYCVVDDDIIFRIAPGTKLTAALLGAPVAFEVDDLGGGRGAGWSVMVVGEAAEITDPELIDDLRRLPLESWAPSGDDRFVRMSTTHVSGRRLAPIDADSG